MFRPICRLLLICFALLQVLVLGVRAQETTPEQPPAIAPKAANLDYADNTRGLERLAKDIMNAQKEGNESRAMELAQSMLLPDSANWYLQTFGPNIANDEGAKYAADRKNLPAEILKVFFGAIQNHFTEVTAARFGDSCDDNAGENAFGTLQLRLDPSPLYELRLGDGNRFLRLFALVYVDGGFRYALAPRVPDHFPYRERTTVTTKVQIATGESASSSTDKKPIRIGGSVQAARLVNRVQPKYPGGGSEGASSGHCQAARYY